MNMAKATLRGKFIALNGNSRKEERPQINGVKFYLKKTKKSRVSK